MGLSGELFHVDFKGRAKSGHTLLQARKTTEDVLTAHGLSAALGAQRSPKGWHGPVHAGGAGGGVGVLVGSNRNSHIEIWVY